MHEYRDIPRIYTGIAEIMSCFLYCELTWQGEESARRFFRLAVGIAVQCAFLTLTGGLPLFLWIPCMGLAFGLMFVFLYWNLSRDTAELVYLTLRAFLLSEFIASAHWQVYSVLTDFMGENIYLRNGSMVVTYALLFVLAFLLEKRLRKTGARQVYAWSEVFAALLIVLAVFGFSNLGFLVEHTSIGITRLGIFNTRTLVDLGGLAILYAYQFRIGQLETARELEALHAGLKTQYENYRNYQDTLELINIKYHDLKHQTLLLRSELDPDRRNVHLNELERELTGFQPEKQTGNHVLDVILAGKSVKMRNAGILFTCVADGKLLAGMHVTDICTIFGNALDNAIEHVAQIEDEQKRLISMTLARRREFIYIEVSNYCEKPPEMRDGLPVTTKKGEALHGYGLRSMIYTARKYGGDLTLEEKNHFFVVRILIPVCDEKQTV